MTPFEESIVSLIVVALFSFLSFWKPEGKLHSVLFLLTGGCSFMLAFYLHSYIPTPLGVALSLMMVGYAFMCLGYALKLLFTRGG